MTRTTPIDRLPPFLEMAHFAFISVHLVLCKMNEFPYGSTSIRQCESQHAEEKKKKTNKKVKQNQKKIKNGERKAVLMGKANI